MISHLCYCFQAWQAVHVADDVTILNFQCQVDSGSVCGDQVKTGAGRGALPSCQPGNAETHQCKQDFKALTHPELPSITMCVNIPIMKHHGLLKKFMDTEESNTNVICAITLTLVLKPTLLFVKKLLMVWVVP